MPLGGLLPYGAELGGLLAAQSMQPQGLFGAGFNDPRTQGILSTAAALLQAGGPSLTPTSFGSNLGQGLQAGIGAFNQGRQTAIQNALLKRRLNAADAAAKTFEDPVLADVARHDPQLAIELSRQASGALDPAGWREFQNYSQAAGLRPGSPEYQQAAKVHLGLLGRASSAGFGFKEVLGADGRTRLVRVDPRTGAVLPGQEEAVISPTQREQAFETTTGTREAGRQADLRASFPSATSNLERIQDRTQRVSMLVNNILPKVDIFTAGLAGKRLSEISGTAARDLAANLQTLQAIAGFSELEQMRRSSPTGGALGQVSERELQFLQATLANIENSQSPEQLRENLLKFEQAVQGSWQRVRDAYSRDYGQFLEASEVPGVSSPATTQKGVQRYNPATGKLE